LTFDTAPRGAEHLRGWAPRQEPTPDARKRIEEAAKAARSKVFALTVTTNIDAAELSVDGAPIGRAPLGAELFLDAGKHVVAAKLEGYDVAQREIEAKAGASASVRLELTKLQAPGPSSVGATEPPKGAPQGHADASGDRGGTRPTDKSVVPLVVGGSLFALGLAAGIGFTVAANGKQSDRDDLLAGLPSNSACRAGSTSRATCDKISQLEDDRSRFRTFEYLGFAVAGAAAVGTAAYWFWPRGTTTAIVPSLSPHGATVRAAGSF
jgi:hypothetical protein